MSISKTLETEKGPLLIEMRFVQMVESNQKKLIEIKAVSIDPPFFNKEEIRIPWSEEWPTEKEIEDFQKKVTNMFAPPLPKGFSKSKNHEQR